MSRRARRGPGRPHALTPRRREAFLTALKAGNRRAAACRYAGLNEQSVYEWVRRGQGGDPDRPATPFMVQFAEQVLEAEAHAEVFAVAQNRQAMGRDPAAARWWLENRSPDWRQRTLQPVNEPAAPLQLQQTTQVLILTDEQARNYGLDRVRQLRQANGDDDAAATSIRIAGLVEDVAAPSTEG